MMASAGSLGGAGGTPRLVKPGQPSDTPQAPYVGASLPNVVRFKFQDISPPSPLYVQRDDVLQLVGTTQLAGGDILNVTARILLPLPQQTGQPGDPPIDLSKAEVEGGQPIITIQRALPLPTPNVSVTLKIQLAEGYLLSVEAVGTSTSNRGLTFCAAAIIRNAVTAFNSPSETLFADYVFFTWGPTWPGGRILGSIEGPGFLSVQGITAPAAGADFTTTVPAGMRWRPITFSAVLTTSAVAANRQPEIIITNGVNTIWQCGVQASIVASTAASVTGTTTNPGTDVVATNFHFTLPPAMFMEGGYVLKSLTAGIQAADQWSSIVLQTESWLVVA